jgi:hypothetical protein
VFFLFGPIFALWVANQKETSAKLYKGLLSEFFLGEKSPYLDNEFLLVAGTKQDSPKKET